MSDRSPAPAPEVSPLLDERAVDQQVLDEADHRQSRRTEGEADRAAALDHVRFLTSCSVAGSVAHIGRPALNPERVPEDIEVKGFVGSRELVAPHNRPPSIPPRRLRDKDSFSSIMCSRASVSLTIRTDVMSGLSVSMSIAASTDRTERNGEVGFRRTHRSGISMPNCGRLAARSDKMSSSMALSSDAFCPRR